MRKDKEFLKEHCSLCKQEIKSNLGVPPEQMNLILLPLTSLVALFPIILVAVFLFVYVHFSSYTSSHYFVLHLYLTCLS